jgi:DNA-binding transcriptional MerR regulator
MAWSTREIAELAGTSLRAVRHYHEVGLLPEPERRSNGYKQYGVAHLVRLLRIKRLVDLGFSLARIAELGEDDHHPADALRTVDAEMGATIERLQRARVELGLILRHHAPADLPADLVPAAARPLLPSGVLRAGRFASVRQNAKRCTVSGCRTTRNWSVARIWASSSARTRSSRFQ